MVKCDYEIMKYEVRAYNPKNNQPYIFNPPTEEEMVAVIKGCKREGMSITYAHKLECLVDFTEN